MGTLKFVGGFDDNSDEIATRGYVDGLLDGNLSQAEINAKIANRLNEYATLSYVNTKDGTLADSAYIDAQDRSRLAKSSLNQPGQPFTLDGAGKIPGKLINVSDLQKFPQITVGGDGGGGTTSSDISLMSIPVPDPGYPYKLLVTGSVSASVAVDNGSRPVVTVYRGDGAAVAQGYGISESYQSPPVGAVDSRMYINTPILFPPNQAQVSGGFIGFGVTLTTGWLQFSWTPSVESGFTSVLSSDGKFLVAQSSTDNATLRASVSYSGAQPNIGDASENFTAEIQIANQGGNVLATASSKTYTGTLIAEKNLSVKKGDAFTVYGKMTMFALGTLAYGNFATWAPTGSGTANRLTLSSGLAPGFSGGDITVMPLNYNSQSAFSGSTTLSVRLSSPGGTSITATTSPSPRIMAIPIPA